MPSTRDVQPHVRTIQGMDSTTPAHLLGDDKWTMCRGMRSYYGKLIQVPGFLPLGVIDALATITDGFFSLPTGVRSENLAVTVSLGNNPGVWQYRVGGGSLKLATISITDPGDSQLYNRVVGTVYNNQVWLTSPTIRLKYTDGSRVVEYNNQIPGTVKIDSLVIPAPIYTIINYGTGGDGLVILKVRGVVLIKPGDLVTISQTGLEWLTGGPFLVTGAAIFSNGNSTTITYIKTPTPSILAFGNVSATITLYNSAGTVSGGVGRFTATTSLNNLFSATQRVRFTGFNQTDLNGVVTITSILDSKSFAFSTNSQYVGTDANIGICQPEFGNINVPSSRYITNFFDHLVVLNSTFRGIYEPWTQRWSHLYDPGQWDPSPENEADFFDLVGWQRANGIVAGGTGMGRLGDSLFTYTESCIFKTDYVGLPKVMQVKPVWEDYGNFFYYGLVASRNVHLFFDVSYQNFFIFDGFNRPKAIGDPILGFFLANITFSFKSTDITQELMAFSVNERNEGWWVFYASTLASWVALIYNWNTDAWSILKLGFRIKSIGGGGTRALICDEMVGTSDGLADTCDNQSKTDVVVPKMFIGEASTGYGGFFYRETSSSENTNATFPEMPFMETKDYTTDLQKQVEVDRICIHADHNRTTTTAGIKVFVSARDNLQDPVVYKQVGTWTKFTPQGTVSFPPVVGRIFRYKFQLSSTGSVGDLENTLGKLHDWTFFDFTDNIFNTGAEQ